jgi:hypothetical protein|uniref:Terminase n=1 Tax=viral metagenome TaxID=1070528 RepID=A0A6C0B2B2_9ZZZZ
MQKIEERFLTLLRSNRLHAFYAAHRILDDIGTSVLYIAARELVSRARYLYITDTLEKAECANQMASQIVAVLDSRNQDVSELNADITKNLQMF